ncbi:MAG: CoB--CoM heterodisulfide reductase iron-sulfur subunit A family protein, partial [Proteobacteria bacterium]|nr:CoB--CoM heterodisulfide reductase iron-sulfur subunit A family protein [Pseudomonadota bacterium]
MDAARVGVWICDCKGLVSDNVDTEQIEAAAKSLDSVVHVRRVGKLCGQAEMKALEAEISGNGVQRLLFAGCSVRSSLKFPERQLKGVMASLDIDPAFLECANLREQCAWLHKDREEATRKGIDVVRMAHARLLSADLCSGPTPVVPRALIIGGGPAGLQAAKSLASAGIESTIVEQNAYLGGRLCQANVLFQCEASRGDCRSECVGPVQAEDAIMDPKIEVLTRAEVLRLEKMNGNFQARIRTGPPFVDPDQCISCAKCADVCPETVLSPHDQGLFTRKAIDKDFERAVPDTYNIIDEACTRCGDCLPVCPTNAIDLEAKADLTEREYGAVFLATGFDQPDLTRGGTYGDPSNDGVRRVLTGLQFERISEHGIVNFFDDEPPERITFVLCAGSRATMDRAGQGVTYCSKTCCGITIKQASHVLKVSPMTEVVIVYNKDIRTVER